MNRVLVANRGAIATRIIRTLNRLEIESVAVYHNEESNLKYLSDATFSINLGDGPLDDNFLNINKIISVAKEQKCDAIHPGYGFLSENSSFAKACEENNIQFIGPSSEVIRLMGLKSEAKKLAKEAGIPVLEGYPIQQNEVPADIEYPVLIKAVAGGGGRGLKTVRKADDLQKALQSASREALQYFGNPELMVEPYIEDARHIEVQVLGNNHGEIIHLFERECSIQRNHQKIIEEAPAPDISEHIRQDLYRSAKAFASRLHYTGVGTIEFLVKDNSFWFLEMNTRIQVEHAVTEEVTGIDVVEEQVNIARGNHFSEKVKGASVKGHALEVRLYAEDPMNNYRPSAGEILLYNGPENCRAETFIQKGTRVTTYFDSLLGKLIVHTEFRDDAIRLMLNELAQVKVLGIKTNISFLKQIIEHPDFKSNKIHTRFLDDQMDYLTQKMSAIPEKNYYSFLSAAFIYNHFVFNPYSSVWQKVGVNLSSREIDVVINGETITCRTIAASMHELQFEMNNTPFQALIIESTAKKIKIKIGNRVEDIFFSLKKDKKEAYYTYKEHVITLSSPQVLSMAERFIKKKNSSGENGANKVHSPIFGKVLDVFVKPDDVVAKGDLLLTIESMKTENNILAPSDGKIDKILVSTGGQVAENTDLLTLSHIV